jgi:gliding-associated putative ABC transporter substrate-binding component GldG
MRGGKVLFLIDALNADMDSLVRSGKEFTAYARDLRLDDLIFKYGARINGDLVQDMQSDVLPQSVGMVGNQPQIEILPWPYFPLLYSQSNHPIAKNLDAVVMQFPNSVDTVKAEGIRKNILLSTSNTSRKIGAPVIVTVEILKQVENASAFKESGIPLAVLLEGKFKSLFANRLPKEIMDSLAAMGRPYLAQGNKEGQVLVTGDGDWVLNGFNREGPLSMGTNPYTQYSFANKNFLLNAIDYMTDESGIMTARSKDFTLRVLDPRRLEKEKTRWQWINIGLPLLLLLLAGATFAWLRRKKYAA